MNLTTEGARSNMSDELYGENAESHEPLRIALNGFGRVGRTVLRASLSRDDVEIVAINDVIDDDMEYLLRYDSVHGRLDGVSREGDVIFVGDRESNCSPNSIRRCCHGLSLGSMSP